MNSHPISPNSNIIEKRGKKYKRGTRPKPSEKKTKGTRTENTTKKQPPTEI